MGPDIKSPASVLKDLQPKPNFRSSAKLGADEVLFKVVGKNDGRRHTSVFERKMHVKDDKVSAEHLLKEQASDILKFATMKFNGHDIPYVYGVLGVVAGHSDNGASNNINYEIPAWLLDILRASANEKGGFELGVEDEHGNVRMLSKGNLQQLHNLGGKTLVLFYSEAHQYDGTLQEAQHAHEGSILLDDAISNVILFTLQPDRLISPLHHQSISSSLGHPALQYRENPLIKDFAFFDGLSPEMMRLSHELGKKQHYDKPFNPAMSAHSSGSFHAPVVLFGGESPSYDGAFAPGAPPSSDSPSSPLPFSSNSPAPSSSDAPSHPSYFGFPSSSSGAFSSTRERSHVSSIWQGASDKNQNKKKQANISSRSPALSEQNKISLALHLGQMLHALGQKIKSSLGEKQQASETSKTPTMKEHNTRFAAVKNGIKQADSVAISSAVFIPAKFNLMEEGIVKSEMVLSGETEMVQKMAQTEEKPTASILSLPQTKHELPSAILSSAHIPAINGQLSVFASSEPSSAWQEQNEAMLMRNTSSASVKSLSIRSSSAEVVVAKADWLAVKCTKTAQKKKKDIPILPLVLSKAIPLPAKPSKDSNIIGLKKTKEKPITNKSKAA